MTERRDDLGARLRERMGLLTEEDVAALMEVTEKTVRNWRYNRTGPPFVKVGDRVVYRQAAFLGWLEGRQTDTE